MKIRCGFVSNSSSSSFMILGIDGDFEQYNEELDKYVDDVFNIHGTTIRGIMLHEVSTDGFNHGDDCISIPELYDMAEKMAKEYNVKLSDIQVFSGIMES